MAKNLRKEFKTKIAKDLMSTLGYKNQLEVPMLKKIVVNMGMGEAMSDSKYLDSGLNDMKTITGQKPLITRAKKSIATYKIREGGPVGCIVTLRGQRMYDFFSKLVNLVLPRLRDFKGVSPKSFDGRGSYNLGLKEQIVFPEIKYDKVDNVRGMDIAIVTTARTNKEGLELLKALGMPFRK
ncbi:MAG: 50S ribosomal protein L5 [Candidatus Melainabacteria bacterium RIFCSPLOWO2_02_FULL_35_15]|nr:MAG: 50S ribosomal protein L5 [Candidatus Melainabacteria bacterium RIFCSPLOWO2_12_FULL_35_11]OGI12861.1 MAG: 50S ribosomal protein L5 [Candidatus Melainabacteria bacterium RIFCSPLOWO2_02_FULL_35_15]